MQSEERPREPALPATVTFVIILGVIIVVGWFLMFHLTATRW